MTSPLNAREFRVDGRLQSGMTSASQLMISSQIAGRVAEPEQGRDSVMQTADAIAVRSVVVRMCPEGVPSSEPVVARSPCLSAASWRVATGDKDGTFVPLLVRFEQCLSVENLWIKGRLAFPHPVDGSAELDRQ